MEKVRCNNIAVYCGVYGSKTSVHDDLCLIGGAKSAHISLLSYGMLYLLYSRVNDKQIAFLTALLKPIVNAGS